MKNVIVTGGGSGIGRAICQRLAEDGYHIVILDLDEGAGFETVGLVKEAGGSAECLACDVSSTESVQEVFAGILRIDALINCAGIASIGKAADTTPEEMDRIYGVNVKGIYHCIYFAIPKMIEGGGGAIVNMASMAAKVGIQERFAYSMSKGAAVSMTLSVARDYLAEGIRANCICPARIHTPFVDGYLEKNYPEEERAEMFQKLSEYQPIGRMGKPSEVAELAAFLCSDKAAFITGSAYDIDGGATLLR
jgi:NAD(P)-dependent dehydrogenase (short-subunit alcohol dehydrogenase family)